MLFHLEDLLLGIAFLGGEGVHVGLWVECQLLSFFFLSDCSRFNSGPQSYAQVVTPEPAKVTLFGRTIFAHVIVEFEMRSPWI